MLRLNGKKMNWGAPQTHANLGWGCEGQIIAKIAGIAKDLTIENPNPNSMAKAAPIS
jgi:hypothetical protein